ncbi:hypothetical protein KSP40_PGU021929 [Platanthera guangdongensis]|uniref:Uncharacterized protein n=1 Tax=Platanthera guangdongensis TaxID=2320717 RepID=A0ABR2LBH6_9ASPA
MSAQKTLATPAHHLRFPCIDSLPPLEAHAVAAPPPLHPSMSLLLQETLAPCTSHLAPRPRLSCIHRPPFEAPFARCPHRSSFSSSSIKC